MKPTPVFDPQAFLAKAAEGQTITKYQAGHVVFAQGDPAEIVGASGSIGFDDLSAMASELEGKLVALQTPGLGVSPAMLQDVAALSGQLERLARATKPEHSRLYNTDLAAAADANSRDRAKAV